jgi:hypothetical protein
MANSRTSQLSTYNNEPSQRRCINHNHFSGYLHHHCSRLKTFVRSMMKQHGLTEQEVTKRAVKMYGSLEYAMQVMETAEADSKAAMERAFPNGYQNAIQVGVSDVAFSELED